MAADKFGPPGVAFQVAVDPLLQFLRIKGGQGPNELALQVDPSIDVTDFYGAPMLVSENFAPGPVAIGTGVSSGVIALPRRYLGLAGGITIGAAAGTWVTLGLSVRIPNVATNIALAAASFTPIIGAQYRIAAPLLDGLVLPGGHTLFIEVSGNAAGADHLVFLNDLYQRLDGLP